MIFFQHIINKKKMNDTTASPALHQRAIGFETSMCFASGSLIVEDNATIKMFSTWIKIIIRQDHLSFMISDWKHAFKNWQSDKGEDR